MEKIDATTPMMRQYLDIKKNYKDAILFFRLGDFYEMFFDEAVEVSRILNLTLTKRNGIPMCGIPYHAHKVYVARLLRAGKKIAICEQVSDAAPGELTKREVTEVITAGIATEEDFLDADRDNYLMAIYAANKKTYGIHGYDYYHSIAYIDVSSGAFYASSFLAEDFEKELFKEIGRLSPTELIIQDSLSRNDSLAKRLHLECPNILITSFPDVLFSQERAFDALCNFFKTETLRAFGLEKTSTEVIPAAIILEYLESTSKKLLLHVHRIKVIEEGDFLSIDYSTRKNLELVSNLNDGTSSYTLLEVMNHTKTAMGSRLLRRRLQEAVRSKEVLENRLDAVEKLLKNETAFSSIRSSLASISDMQRLIARIAMQKANARELLTLSKSIKEALSLISCSTKNTLGMLSLTWKETDTLSKIYTLLATSINEDAPNSIGEVGTIKDGYSQEVDQLRRVHNDAQEILERYVASERQKTGIQNLKIKYNKLIGYFLEVSKSNWEKAPAYFVKKRSVSNSDRYTTERLEKIVEEISNAEEKLVEVEKKLFIEIREKVVAEYKVLQHVGQEIAELDVMQSLADVARTNNWTRPVFTADGSLKVVNGRHPVVEANMKKGEFIPNSLYLLKRSENEAERGDENDEKSRGVGSKRGAEMDETLPSFAIITGPNMAGKSTFLRQTALIVLLSQIGSYVPADYVELTPCDKIFCRVGAQDNLARGESTFLVEMTETSYILQNATEDSLVIMDEVGRGTSTEDGISIAQACSEYLLDNIGAKTLFATHYRELAQLKNPHLINLKLDIIERDGKIVFLKRVVKGISKSSYGIHVAQLAGLPREVLERAKNLLHMRTSFAKQDESVEAKDDEERYSVGCESDEKTECLNEPNYACSKNVFVDRGEQKLSSKNTSQPILFGEELQVINDILNQDLDNITPLMALQKLSEWQKSLM